MKSQKYITPNILNMHPKFSFPGFSQWHGDSKLSQQEGDSEWKEITVLTDSG